jgi:hypothetical protein
VSLSLIRDIFFDIGCVGVADVKEYQVSLLKESRSWRWKEED